MALEPDHAPQGGGRLQRHRPLANLCRFSLANRLGIDTGDSSSTSIAEGKLQD